MQLKGLTCGSFLPLQGEGRGSRPSLCDVGLTSWRIARSHSARRAAGAPRPWSPPMGSWRSTWPSDKRHSGRPIEGFHIERTVEDAHEQTGLVSHGSVEHGRSRGEVTVSAGTDHLVVDRQPAFENHDGLGRGVPMHAHIEARWVADEIVLRAGGGVRCRSRTPISRSWMASCDGWVSADPSASTMIASPSFMATSIMTAESRCPRWPRSRR